MLDKSKRQRRKPTPVKKEERKLYENKKPSVDFSYYADRSFTNFGFGSYTSELGESFVTTDDIRKALDKAFRRKDVKGIKTLSRHFYRVSGVYSRAAEYLAYLPTYDYMITPRVVGTKINEDTIVREVVNQLLFLEKAKLKQSLQSISLDVIVDGVAYVYFRRRGKQAVFQKLPTSYCRTRSVLNGFPTVEFNLDYFEQFGTEEEKAIKLNNFPPEIVREYNIWKNDNHRGRNSSKRRQNQSLTNSGTWILLNPDTCTAFYFSPSLQPVLANSFFAILDVMELKGIEKKKAENELYNLVVQKFGFLDDGEPILELPEMQAFHESAKKIFENSNQTDLLTTLGEIQNVNLNEAAADPIDFEPWTKSIYAELGVSPQLFSTEGNMALEKSVNIDEAMMFTLVEKYQNWLNFLLDNEFLEDDDDMFDTSLWFPPITINNRNELSTKYKDMATLGYSKLLPALSLGQSQLDIMASPIFENSILNLGSIMKPLQSSHTASGKSNSSGSSSSGRPPLPDSQKSEKTIQNAGG